MTDLIVWPTKQKPNLLRDIEDKLTLNYQIDSYLRGCPEAQFLLYRQRVNLRKQKRQIINLLINRITEDKKDE